MKWTKGMQTHFTVRIYKWQKKKKHVKKIFSIISHLGNGKLKPQQAVTRYLSEWLKLMIWKYKVMVSMQKNWIHLYIAGGNVKWQPFWKVTWQILVKLNAHLSYNPAIVTWHLIQLHLTSIQHLLTQKPVHISL